MSDELENERGLISREDVVAALTVEKLIPEGFYDGDSWSQGVKYGATTMLTRVGIALAKLPLASLRARPQEPGDLISKQSAFDVAQKCFEDGWDGIRLYEDADGNVTEGDDDAHSWWEGYAAGVQDVQTKVDAILSAPSGPLSDPEGEVK
jgi:hypothetical protein